MRTLLLATITAAALAGCQGPEVRPPSERPQETTALALVADGRYPEAAEEYAALSRNARGAVAQELMLKAVTLLLGIGRTERASDLMEELAGQTIAAGLTPGYDLLTAHLALQRGAPERTLELLSGPAADRFDGESASTFHLLRARAYEDTGRFLDAARERIALDATLTDATRRAANHHALWDALTRSGRDRREQALPGATGAFAGWLRLAAVFEEHRSIPAALERALAEWRAAFPGHPAGAEIVTAILGTARESVRPPERIALLLPFHGDLAEAAGVIRDGFLAAWFADASSSRRPTIELHDTSFEAAGVVYARAVEAGADFVVGPLRRGPVASLACGGALLVTTLALNEIGEAAAGAETAPPCGPGQAVPELYHFSLTPEAEARQVAGRAWADGFGKALALTREGGWGDRVYRAFAGEWERIGGVLLDHRALPPDATGIGEPIAAALGVSRSHERAREIRRTLGRAVEHEPRRRQDVDFVFMAAFPAGARQIKPQLAFHHGAELPVYSTAHVWSGTPDPVNDRDLDGIVFGDMPWLIAPAEPARIPREPPGVALAGGDPELPRLYAFGADAYRLATALRRIAGDESASIDGLTGRLSAGADHRIVRRLAWARFSGGLPAPHDPVARDVESPPIR